MELTVDDLGEGNLSLTATIIRKEPRSSVALFDISTRSSEEVVMICSWCKKIPVSHDQWVEVEDAVQALDLFITYPLPQLSHGMCPQCASEVAETMTRPSVVAGAASESSAPPDE